MSSVKQIGSRTNEVIELFNGLIDNKEDLMFKGEWVESVDSLGEFINEIRRVPMQAGNDGKPKNTLTPVQQPQQVQSVQQMQPTMQTPTGIVKTDSGLSFQSIMGNQMPQVQMQMQQ